MLVIAQVTKLLRKYLAAGRLQAATNTSAGAREQHDVLTQHTQPAVAAMENEALGSRLRGGGMSRSGGGDGGARRRGGPRTNERERERERTGQRDMRTVRLKERQSDSGAGRGGLGLVTLAGGGLRHASFTCTETVRLTAEQSDKDAEKETRRNPEKGRRRRGRERESARGGGGVVVVGGGRTSRRYNTSYRGWQVLNLLALLVQ
jgi:hypothetical protein